MNFLFNNLEPSPVVVLTLGKSRQYTLFDQGMERLGSTSLLAINGCAGFEVAALVPRHPMQRRPVLYICEGKCKKEHGSD
jgi:hypothetical protein